LTFFFPALIFFFWNKALCSLQSHKKWDETINKIKNQQKIKELVQVWVSVFYCCCGSHCIHDHDSIIDWRLFILFDFIYCKGGTDLEKKKRKKKRKNLAFPELVFTFPSPIHYLFTNSTLSLQFIFTIAQIWGPYFLF